MVKRIVFIGDSITDSGRREDPEHLRDWLCEDYS